MQHVIETGKRALSVAIAAATIAFSVGVASFVSPVTAHAASAGDLIKGTSLSTVYYYGFDGMRYTFPNEKTYFSWYSDFSSVSTISDSALADITLGGNVVMRPGTYWVKIQSDPKTYAVSPDGSIHWIESESVASGLAGSNWASSIVDVPDVFFTDYSVGTSLMSATAFDGALYSSGGNTYLSWGGEARKVTSAGMSANRFRSAFVLDGSSIDASALTAGSDVSSAENALWDAAQNTSTTVTSTGGVTVSVASSTPAGATLPGGANAVNVFSFKIAAGNEAATVSAIAATMQGVGATSAVSNAYLYEGSTRLTDARSVNSSTRMTTFNNLGLAFAANTSRTFSIRVEVNASQSAGDVIAFEIAAASDITSGGSVSGSFPVMGNNFPLATVDAGTVTVTKNGTITNPTLGAVSQKIGEFKIAVSSEDASITEIILKIDNGSDHSNYKLLQNGVELAVGSYIGNKLVKFDLSASPFDIVNGNNKIFQVTANIGGDSGDTIGIYFDNKVDLVAIGGNYGFGMQVDITTSGTYDGADAGADGTTCNQTTDDCSFSTIQGGDITFAFTGPAATDIRTNAQDQQLLAFTLTSQNDITIKDMDFIVYADDDANSDATDGVDSSGADADGLIDAAVEVNLSDIKLVDVDSGAVVMGPLELDCTTDAACAATGASAYGDASQTIDFTDDFAMNSGDALHLALTGDIGDLVTSGTEFAAALDISGFVVDDANGDTITNSSSVVPTADITGYNRTANAATLTVARASSPTSTTIVDGQSNVDFLGMSWTAGTSSDITVTALTMSGFADDTNTAGMTQGGAAGFQVENYVSSCSVYSGTTLVAGPEGVQTNGDVNYTNFTWTIPAAATVLLTQRCNTSITSDVDTNDVVAFDLQTTSNTVTTCADITSQDEDGNSPTVSITKDGAGNTLGLNDSSADTTMDADVGITIATSGTIAVAASSGTPSADFVLTGSANNFLGEFNFTATTENFIIDELTISEEAGEDMTGTTNATTYTQDISTVKVVYADEAGATVSNEAVMVSNTADFTGLDFLAETGQNNLVKAYVTVPASNRTTGGSAISNDRLELGVSGAAGEFNATGANSGVKKVGTDITAVELNKQFVVRETKPTISLSSSSPSGAKTPSNQEVFRFNVAAASGRDVVLKNVVFKIATTDNQATNWNQCDTDLSSTGAQTADATSVDTTDFNFYNMSKDGTATAIDANSDWLILKATGAACDTTNADIGFVKLSLATAEVIPAGSTYSYALWMDTSIASSSADDIVQVSLPADVIATAIALGTVRTVSGAHTATVTTLTGSGALDTTAGSAVALGDILRLNAAEYVLVVAYTGSASTATIVRGYLGSTPAALSGGEAITRVPGSLLWEDDGTAGIGSGTGLGATLEYWGGYLVDNLTVTGSAISF